MSNLKKHVSFMLHVIKFENGQSSSLELILQLKQDYIRINRYTNNLFTTENTLKYTKFKLLKPTIYIYTYQNQIIITQQ